jgi:hypothetical protein
MKQIRILTTVFALAICSFAFGQNVKNVSKFQSGTILSSTDLEFLNIVNKTTISPSRGQGEKLTVTINGKTYTEGQTLSADDVNNLKTALEDFEKNNKGKKKAKGGGTGDSRGACCYYYYYCTYSGYCYYYWRCYC